MRTLMLALVLAFSLTACGSPSFDSAEAVAKAANCENFTPTDPGLVATDAGSCTFDGTEIYIHWFKSAKAIKAYREIGDALGGGRILYGDNFAIECDPKSLCDKLRAKVGGEIG